MRTLLLIFFLLTASFAAQLWDFSANAPMSTQPIVFNGNIAVASHDGYLYVLKPSGTLLWKKPVGKYPLQPSVFGGDIVIATTKGHLLMFKKDGTAALDLTIKNVIYVYGLTTADKIYLTTNRGVISVDKTGNAASVYEVAKNDTVLTPPTVSGDLIIFGVGDEIVAVKAGRVKWKTNVGTVWKSRPVIAGNAIYIGTLDNALYSIDLNNGMVRWKKKTDGWIVGSPTIDGQFLYFGDTGGSLYAIDTVTGGTYWSTKLGGGIESTPAVGTLGGKDVLLVGSDDYNLYAIDRFQGKTIWRWAARGRVGSPLFYDGNIIVPSHDGSVYGFSATKACMIAEPKEGSAIGQKEVKLKGTIVGDNEVFIRVEGGEWKGATVDGESWSFRLDPGPLQLGLNTIECKAGAAEAEPHFTYTLVKADVPPSQFLLSYPMAVDSGEEFEITVLDAENGEPVEEFTITVDGKSSTATGTARLKFSQPGEAKITIKKTGFNDAVITVDVRGGINIGLIAIGAVILLALLYFYFVIYKRK